MADGIEGRDKSALSERERNCRETGDHVFFLFSPFPLYSPLLMPHCAYIPCPFLSRDMGLGGGGQGKRERKKEKVEKDTRKSHGRSAWKWRSSVTSAQRVTSFDGLRGGLICENEVYQQEWLRSRLHGHKGKGEISIYRATTVYGALDIFFNIHSLI